MGSSARAAVDAIGAALFGATRQAALRLFFGHVDERFYQRQVIRTIGLGTGAVQRELEQLTRAGILTRTVEGHQTYYQANRHSPVFDELRSLARKTFGVAQVLQESLKSVHGVRLAFIYGSMAEGSETAASDVDVMIVGDRISSSDVVSSIGEVQGELRREVNPTVYRTSEFCRKLAEGHHFLSSVVDGPKILLIGGEDELKRLARKRVAQGAQNKPARNRRSAKGG